MEDNNQKLLMNIYQRLENERDRNNAINELNLITKSYYPSEEINET
jgi:hypothetical protein